MTETIVDYKRLDYYHMKHRQRFVQHVLMNGLPCQDCKGEGGEIEPILDFGEGPFIECGWCLGTGKTTRWLRGQWLRYKREAKSGV